MGSSAYDMVTNVSTLEMNEGVDSCLLPKETGCFRSLRDPGPIVQDNRSILLAPWSCSELFTLPWPRFPGPEGQNDPKEGGKHLCELGPWDLAAPQRFLHVHCSPTTALMSHSTGPQTVGATTVQLQTSLFLLRLLCWPAGRPCFQNLL